MRVFVIAAAALLVATASTPARAELEWRSPLEGGGAEGPYVSGRWWNAETGASLNRLPTRFKATMPASVWGLSTQSAGLSVRFATSSRDIAVRYVLAGKQGYLNMAWLDHSGVDLYAKGPDSRLHYIGNHMGWRLAGDTVTITFNNLEYPAGAAEFTLYLPPYNGVRALWVGAGKGAEFRFLRPAAGKPVVVYGSSIVQGASPSRPGLMFTNIVEREASVPVINLGFSGSALMEPAVFDMLSEIPAAAFVLDPVPNSVGLAGDTIVARACAGVRRLRQASQAPIVMMEAAVPVYPYFRKNVAQKYEEGNRRFREAYYKLRAEGVKGLSYVPNSKFGFTEASFIEGTHPNDHGNREYADAYLRALRKAGVAKRR